MAVKQLSVFVENKEGAMAVVADILAQSQIDIEALSIADTTDFGILRLIVNDTEKAVKALHEKGIVVSVSEVIAAVMPDKAGSLSKVIRVFADANINIEYMYSFRTSIKKCVCLAIKVEDINTAVELLNSKGIKTIGNQEI